LFGVVLKNSEWLADVDIDRHDPVSKSGLLEKDRDVVAVRNGPLVESRTLQHLSLELRA